MDASGQRLSSCSVFRGRHSREGPERLGVHVRLRRVREADCKVRRGVRMEAPRIRREKLDDTDDEAAPTCTLKNRA